MYMYCICMYFTAIWQGNDIPYMYAIVCVIPHSLSRSSADQVAVGVLKLILDTSKAGAIMALTSEYGATFPELPSMPQ